MELRDKNGLTEAEYLAAYDASKFPHPSLTTDLALFFRDGAQTKVLLVKRGGHPHLGKWALPGGFCEPGETVDKTAARELYEETHVAGITPELVGIFSKPGRDPRGWCVSALFMAAVDEMPMAQAGDDAREAAWFDVCALPVLAFDHAEMIRAALSKLFTK